MTKNNQEAAKPLLPAQKKTLGSLKEYGEWFRQYEGRSFEEIESLPPAKKKEFLKFYKAYQEDIITALKKGLLNHPEVPEEIKALLRQWVLTHQRLGNWKLLRKPRRGLEVEVRKPITEKELELIELVMERREKGWSWSRIFRNPSKISGFKKKLIRTAALIDEEILNKKREKPKISEIEDNPINFNDDTTLQKIVQSPPKNNETIQNIIDWLQQRRRMK